MKDQKKYSQPDIYKKIKALLEQVVRLDAEIERLQKK